MSWLKPSFAAGALLLPLLTATAQEKEKKPGNFEIPIKVEFRLRSEIRKNYDLRGSKEDGNSPILQRFRLSIAPRWKSLRLFAQLQDSPVWNREGSPYSSADFHMYQLFFETPLAHGFKLRTGRQELNLGEERLLGGFGWDNRGRVFDAVTAFREGKNHSFRIFGANLASPRVRNRPRGQNLFGISSKRIWGETALEIHALWLHDQALVRGETKAGRTRILTSGARFTQKRGLWSNSVEGAWQLGRRNGDEHFGAALAARTDYTWQLRRRPQAGMEYAFASGDGDLSDGKSREFHNLFPTNHPFYGTMDLFGWRNLHNLRLIGAIDLHKRIRIEANYHEFWLARSRGVWRNAGGQPLSQDMTGASGRRIGNEMDLLTSYSFSSHWKFLFGYSFFVPGRFARVSRGEDPAHFVYFQSLTTY